LERIPGLDFRQGFVTDLRIVDADASEPLSPGSGEKARRAPSAEGAWEVSAAQQQMNAVQIETVFGEVLEAQAVVVAAGLSLGASTVVGTATVQGGRYGEPSSEGLCAALRALGAEYRETSIEVGLRVAAGDAATDGWLLADAGEGYQRVASELLVLLNGEGDSEPWPADYPPAPHRDNTLRIDRMVMRPSEGENGEVGPEVPVLSPDGGATAELYVAPGSTLFVELKGGAGAAGAAGVLVATRMPSTVAGKVLIGLSESGRLALGGLPGPVWVVGRAAGARDYAASLASGVRAAADIAEWFGLHHAPTGLAGTQPGTLLERQSALEVPGTERNGGGAA